MDASHYGHHTTVKVSEAPTLCLERDGSWTLVLDDARMVVVLNADQVRSVNEEYVSQMAGGPFED